jgi:hypothetical protein
VEANLVSLTKKTKKKLLVVVKTKAVAATENPNKPKAFDPFLTPSGKNRLFSEWFLLLLLLLLVVAVSSLRVMRILLKNEC